MKGTQRHVCGENSEQGAVLVTALLLMATLTALGVGAITLTTTDSLITGNHKLATRTFYIAEAGTEHARELLRSQNASSGNNSAFTDELASVSATSGVLIDAASLANSSYTVSLTNDTVDGSTNPTDTNRQVTLTSVATGTNGSQATIEITVRMFQLFPLPAAITLLGGGASFTGGTSNAKALHGDDQCGTESPKPVVAVTDTADVSNLQSSINGSKPETYWTKDSSGASVNATTNPNDVSGAIPSSQLSDINNTFGIDLLNPVDLNGLVTSLQAAADTVAASGTSCSSLEMGSTGDPKVIVVTGDFDMPSSCSGGVGILVVTGTLTYHGAIDYTGLVLVIGEGRMERNGGGNGTIEGGILVANTRGPDNIAGTSDDTVALGPPSLDTSGGGNSSINYCSTALEDAYSSRPLQIVSWQQR